MGNKYLTILAGSPRGGEKTWETLYREVLSPLSSDLAICTGSKWIANQSLLHEAKYKWIFEEPKDWFTYYEEKFNGKWKEFFNQGKNTGLYNSGSIHFAIKDIILSNYLDIIMEYDQVIYTRFDQYYVEKHPNFTGNNIYIPSGEDYLGLCDRHAVIPVDYIANYLNICKYINQQSSITKEKTFINCEVAYKNHLLTTNLYGKVKRYDRKQFTSALKEDRTNWRVPKYKLYFSGGLLLKYPDELISSFEKESMLIKIKYIFSRKNIIFTNYLYLKLRRYVGRLKGKKLNE